MSMPLLPEWARLIWAMLFFGIAAVHVWHAWSMRSQPRWWHVGHTIMAVGMLLMYVLPDMSHSAAFRAGLVVFLLLAAAETAAVIVLARRERAFNPLWASSVVDKLVMAYMLAFPMHGPAVVTYVLIGYLAVQVVAWSFGLWNRVPAVRPIPSEDVLPAPASRVVTPVATPSTGVGLVADNALAVRISLAFMAAGMGHMLVAALI